jgi:hypothetical protein
MIAFFLVLAESTVAQLRLFEHTRKVVSMMLQRTSSLIFRWGAQHMTHFRWTSGDFAGLLSPSLSGLIRSQRARCPPQFRG